MEIWKKFSQGGDRGGVMLTRSRRVALYAAGLTLCGALPAMRWRPVSPPLTS